MKRLYFLSFFIFISFISYAQPANDACPNAILIPTVVNFCSANGAGTTVASTDDVATSGGFGVATCWGGTVNDVWYKFVATASDVTITINGNQGSPVGGTLNRPQVALYSGTCATTLNELVCGSAPAGQNIIQVYRGGLTKERFNTVSIITIRCRFQAAIVQLQLPCAVKIHLRCQV